MFIYSLNDNIISLDELLPLIGGFLMVFLLIIRLLLNLNIFKNGLGKSIPPIISINSGKCNTFTYREWFFGNTESQRFFWVDLTILTGSVLVLLIGIYCTLGIFGILPNNFYSRFVCFQIESKKWKVRVSEFVCKGLNPNTGSQRCNNNRCYLCIHDMVERTNYVKSPNSDTPGAMNYYKEIEESNLYKPLSCYAEFSVYMATCQAKGCNKKFIGSTNHGLNYEGCQI